MKKYFRVGQTVYDAAFGKGVVLKTEGINDVYPIEVCFDEILNDKKYYTHVGKYTVDARYPSLYQNPIVTMSNEPIVEFERGELVWVRDRNIDNIWDVRYYSHYENGVHHYFINQYKCHSSTVPTVEIRKFNDNPLTK